MVSRILAGLIAAGVLLTATDLFAQRRQRPYQPYQQPTYQLYQQDDRYGVSNPFQRLFGSAARCSDLRPWRFPARSSRAPSSSVRVNAASTT